MTPKIAFSLLALIFCMSCQPSTQPESAPPNIVLIFADDMTYTAINALGNKEIETPNLDRLVREGTTFSHNYNMGGWNGAICTASRTMLNSGRSIWRADQFRHSWGAKDSAAFEKSWGKLMERQGYDTYMSGKWHVDAPPPSLFQTTAHIRPGMPGDRRGKQTANFMPAGYGRPLGPDDNSWSPTDTSFGGFWKGGKHWSEILTDDALSFIGTAKDKENPFFMYLAFNAPHDPRQSPQRFIDKYPLENLSIPQSYIPAYPYKDLIGNGKGLRDEALGPFPRTEYAVKVHTQEYYAIITHLDEQVGIMLDGLEKAGKLENTYIFFTADHGLAMGKHGLLGKQSMFDHSLRAPLIVNGPGIPAGKTIDADVYLQDIMPTSLELAGIEKPDYVEFHSLMDLINGSASKHYDAIYGCYVDLQRAIRKDGYKLIVYPKADKMLLFDLQKDPEEMEDLAEQPEYADKVKTMFRELVELQKSYEDTLDLEFMVEK